MTTERHASPYQVAQSCSSSFAYHQWCSQSFTTKPRPPRFTSTPLYLRWRCYMSSEYRQFAGTIWALLPVDIQWCLRRYRTHWWIHHRATLRWAVAMMDNEANTSAGHVALCFGKILKSCNPALILPMGSPPLDLYRRLRCNVLRDKPTHPTSLRFII